MKPKTPASCSGRSCARLPGTAPPQKPTSTCTVPRAASCLVRRCSTVVVGGSELSGMSISVVMPPAAAARVAVPKPSHVVRPGSSMCTWVSTSPGSRASSPRSTRRAPAGTGASCGRTAVMVPWATATEAARVPSGVTTRVERSISGAPDTRTSPSAARGERSTCPAHTHRTGLGRRGTCTPPGGHTPVDRTSTFRRRSLHRAPRPVKTTPRWRGDRAPMPGIFR